MKEQTTEIFKRFGERIQYVRKTEHITLDELNKQSGLSIGQLRKWESGKGMIKTSHEKVHFCESYKDSGKL